MIGMDVSRQVGMLAERYPTIFACIDPARVAAQNVPMSRVNMVQDDFGTSEHGGRGESYVLAQQSTRTRAAGIVQLVDIVTEHSRAESNILVDLLGGDGLVHRVLSVLGRTEQVIVTCDASPFMVRQAWTQGIPALLQRAESPLFRTESVGAVMLAYGSHHIPPALRPTVVREAFRILQPGGLFVIHDFLMGSPMDTWFSKVVDIYASTGHDYVHFTSDETAGNLQEAGFGDIQLLDMEDPFVVWDSTEELAELALGRYLVNMYGLVRLVEKIGERDAHRRAFELACDIFQHQVPSGQCMQVRSHWEAATGTWSMTMPRQALVGYGRKPL